MKDPRMDRIKTYIKMARRNRFHRLTETEATAYEELGRELAMIRGDELLRLLTDPAEVGSVVYTLRS